MVIRLANECDMQKTKLSNYVNNELNNKVNTLNLLHEKLLNHDYRTQLKNGYSLAFDANSNLIKNIDSVKDGEKIKILFDKFSVEAEIINIQEVRVKD